MKLVLDWDENTIDLVIIAIGSYLCDMQESRDRMEEIGTFSGNSPGKSRNR